MTAKSAGNTSAYNSATQQHHTTSYQIMTNKFIYTTVNLARQGRIQLTPEGGLPYPYVDFKNQPRYSGSRLLLYCTL